MARELDPTDWQILTLLQENGRQPFAEIGRQVGLSAPAVTERVRRLEDMGLIEGYTIRLSPRLLGQHVMAFIEVTVPTAKYPAFIQRVEQLPAVLECHHVTGAKAFIVKVMVDSMGSLESLVAQLSPYGSTMTSVVMSSPVMRQPGVSLPQPFS